MNFFIENGVYAVSYLLIMVPSWKRQLFSLVVRMVRLIWTVVKLNFVWIASLAALVYLIWLVQQGPKQIDESEPFDSLRSYQCDHHTTVHLEEMIFKKQIPAGWRVVTARELGSRACAFCLNARGITSCYSGQFTILGADKFFKRKETNVFIGEDVISERPQELRLFILLPNGNTSIVHFSNVQAADVWYALEILGV
jgi:hypothetical protein